MYVDKNFKTKKALKDAVKNGGMFGVFVPNSDVTGFQAPSNGTVCVEGPHYPEPHRWYAQVELVNGVISKVR